MEFAQKHMGKLNEDRFSSNDRSFSHLDPPAVKQMYQVMIKIRGIGRSIESEEPFSDNVSPAIRRMESFLQKISQEEQIQQEVRNFCCKLLVSTKNNRRFDKFADVFCAAAMLNPSKQTSNKEQY